MGEVREITTHPYERKEFFPTRGTGLRVEVKTASSACIGLCFHPTNSPLYRIALGQRTVAPAQPQRLRLRSIMYENVFPLHDDQQREVDNNDAQQTTEPTYSETEFTELWISWYGKTINIGHGSNSIPFRSIQKTQSDPLKYITFYSNDEAGVATWRFEMRPKIKDIYPKLERSRPEWKEIARPFPLDAIIGGHENGEFLYIMRAPHNESLTPGKYVPSKTAGFLAWGGSENQKIKCEILCGLNFQWIPSSNGEVPAGSVYAGKSEQPIHGGVLYVGRARHEGQMVVGKVQPSHKCCYIPYDGEEIAKKHYEVLITHVSDAGIPMISPNRHLF